MRSSLSDTYQVVLRQMWDRAEAWGQDYFGQDTMMGGVPVLANVPYQNRRVDGSILIDVGPIHLRYDSWCAEGLVGWQTWTAFCLMWVAVGACMSPYGDHLCPGQQQVAVG